MSKVAVTLDMRGKRVSLDAIHDDRIRRPLEQMARDIGKKLDKVKCPTHAKGPTDIRVHVDGSGNADLRYESCCEKLKEIIAKAL